MDQLLKCPFCGGEAAVGANEYYDGANTFYIYCASCGVQQMTKIRTDEAIAAWNRRSQTDNEPLTVDELRQMDGEPVWVVFEGDEMSPSQSHWCFVGVCGGQADIYPCDIHEVSDWSYYEKTFEPGGGARAYRRKPERSEERRHED